MKLRYRTEERDMSQWWLSLIKGFLPPVEPKVKHRHHRMRVLHRHTSKKDVWYATFDSIRSEQVRSVKGPLKEGMLVQVTGQEGRVFLVEPIE
jgi:hypothetical protein